MIIYTGSSKCRTLNLMECPACKKEFDVVDGVFVESVTIGARILVCQTHKAFSCNEEKVIQDSLKEAMDNKRGHITGEKRLLKKSDTLKSMSEKELARIF